MEDIVLWMLSDVVRILLVLLVVVMLLLGREKARGSFNEVIVDTIVNIKPATRDNESELILYSTMNWLFKVKH